MRAWSRSGRRDSLQTRITLSIALAVTLAIALSNVAGYVALRSTLVRTSQSIALQIAADLDVPVAASLERTGRLDEATSQAGGVLVEVVRQDGTVLAAPGQTQQLVLEPGDLAVAGSRTSVVRRTGVSTGGQPYVVVAVASSAGETVLVVGRPLGPVLDILAVDRLILVGVGLLSLVAWTLLAGFVARAALRPVRQLIDAVDHVARTKDLQPIQIRHAAGELSVLARAFNDMLRALSVMQERQSQLVADASHELRTPLTSLTTNVQLLVADHEAGYLRPAQRRAILGDVDAQLAELSKLVGDLMHLSRHDSASAFASVELGDVVQQAVDRVQRRGLGHVFDVGLDEFHLHGDADRLERVVTNLLDNAVKWSPPGSTIWVRLTGNRLHVVDSGPGIPEADLPYVFDRFYRGETARHTPGTGLGLSIVAKTVEDHGGTVDVSRDAGGGTRFTIRLPGATSAEALSVPGPGRRRTASGLPDEGLMC